MYALFVDGSRQYRVSEGDLVKVDYRDKPVGESLEFTRVLLVKKDGEAAQVGQPALDGTRVVGDVAEQTSTKVYVQHFKRRKNERRLRGHRQPYTVVRIKHILGPGQEPPPPAPPAPAETPAPPANPAAS